ncbi:MAG: hypothetical protein AAFU03_03365, partial [Bacteroidota bacterium]
MNTLLYPVLRIGWILFTLFFAGSLFGQSLSHRQGELILQLATEVDGKNWVSKHDEIIDARRLGSTLNAWLIRFDFNRY